MVSLCRELGIDDPVAWFNAVPPHLVDLWLAYATLEQDDSPTMNNPDNEFDRIFKGFN